MFAAVTAPSRRRAPPCTEAAVRITGASARVISAVRRADLRRLPDEPQSPPREDHVAVRRRRSRRLVPAHSSGAVGLIRGAHVRRADPQSRGPRSGGHGGPRRTALADHPGARGAGAAPAAQLGRGRDARQEVKDLTQHVLMILFAEEGRALLRWDPDGGASFANFVGLIAEREIASILRSRRRSPGEEPTEAGDLDEITSADPGHEAGDLQGSAPHRARSRALSAERARARDVLLDPRRWPLRRGGRRASPG